ncbi:hypothetical protein BLAT2472_130073 [Burkholderia latens]
MRGRFVFRRLSSGQPLDLAVAPDAAHPVQPQQIACIALDARRKTFHATWKVRVFLEALSFLTKLRLPSVVQHLRTGYASTMQPVYLTASRTGTHEHDA